MSKLFLGIMLIITMSAAAAAQKNKSEPQMVEPGKTSDSGNADKKNRNKAANNVISGRTNLEAQLQSAIDVRKTQVGDEVVLKTTKSVKQDGEVLIPKGSKLVGRVTEVQQRTGGNSQSRIGMVFDRLEGKDLAMPITASVVSIANARSAMTAGDVFASDVSGSSNASGRAASGGGLLGGVGGVVSTAANTVGNVGGTTADTLGGATSTVGRTVRGLQISTSASGSANGSTTLSSGDKDLRLDKGLNFNILVTAAPAN